MIIMTDEQWNKLNIGDWITIEGYRYKLVKRGKDTLLFETKFDPDPSDMFGK